MGVADGADIDAEQLELGRHVGAEERLRLGATEPGGDGAGHLIAGRDQAEDAAIPGRALADGVDVRVAAQALVIDRHAAARAEFQRAGAGQGVLRADAGGEDDQVGLQGLIAGEVHPVAVVAAGADRLRGLAQVHADAEVLDALPERGAAEVVELHRHQARGEFHHVRFQAQRFQRVGCLQAEQAAADHHAAAFALGGGADGVEIVEGAVDQARIALGAFDGRHEGVGTGGQHQLVVGEAPLGGDHLAGGAVDLQHRRSQVQVQAGACVQFGGAHRQGFGIAPAEVFGEVHAVVGALRLLAEHVDPVVFQRAGREQLLDAVVADHAVADDDQALLVAGAFCAVHGGSRRKLIRFSCGKKKRLKPCGSRRLCLFCRVPLYGTSLPNCLRWLFDRR